MPLTAGSILTRPQAQETAREMRDAGWSALAITEYLQRRGHPVSYDTVKRWTNPKYHAAKAAYNRRRQRHLHRRRTGTTRLILVDADAVLLRVHQLDGIHVSATSIAAILTLDYRVQCSPFEVRYVLKNGRLPRHLAERVGDR